MAACGKTKPASRRVVLSGHKTCLTHHSMNGDNNQGEGAYKIHAILLSSAFMLGKRPRPDLANLPGGAGKTAFQTFHSFGHKSVYHYE